MMNLKSGIRAAAPALLALAAGTASAQQPTTIVQIFEAEWEAIENRAADLFALRYDGLWTPPPSRASNNFGVGFDVFDRFDFGQAPITDSNAATIYGTERSFKAMTSTLKEAGVGVYIDTVLNHNSFRTTLDSFFAEGGWPGFHVPRNDPPSSKGPLDDWGDFHGGNQFGFQQSTNPADPNYDVFAGDLSTLCDIDQMTNNQFIRHPVDPGDPMNIPAGSQRNLPDAGNFRFYPDRDLTPQVFDNPALPGADKSVTRYPFNVSDPMAGDPIIENATGLLTRWVQWTVEELGVTGFRLDALKHTEPFFWNQFFDSAVFNLGTAADGSRFTPLSFGESFLGNSQILSDGYYRRDGFGNRDALDMNGASNLRNLVGAGGFANWGDVLGSHLDVTVVPGVPGSDGFQNGNAGVFHVWSHDNGTREGTELPSDRDEGWFAHAYMLTRPGISIVYHNAQQFGDTRGFPDQGVEIALGIDPATRQPVDVIPTLLEIRREHARGQWFPGPIDGDVLTYSMRESGGAEDNIIVGVSDSYSTGTNIRSVAVNLPQGTPLVELTGNAANPMVDPDDIIPEVITVNNGTATITVPDNTSSEGEHNLGYVMYGPAVPDSTLTVPEASGNLPGGSFLLPVITRRVSEVPIVTGDTFTVRLETAQGLSGDLDSAGDNALFKINRGERDFNGSGGPDIPVTSGLFGGFEQFLSLNMPGVDNGGSGVYEQVVDATALPDGYLHINTVAFRRRAGGTTALFDDQRLTVWLDRVAAEVEVISDTTTGELRPQILIESPDLTVNLVHLLRDVPNGVDPLTLIDGNNRMTVWDRGVWRAIPNADLQPGPNEFTAVAIERTGTTSVLDFTITLEAGCNAADLVADGMLDLQDVQTFLIAFGNMEPAADIVPDGMYDLQDVQTFLIDFGAGCP